ncbi:iduronate-2-sulfatase [Bacteroidia bacterium]|nr:iduronate-2-sulfatase [Bacteroidia bacterium]
MKTYSCLSGVILLTTGITTVSMSAPGTDKKTQKPNVLFIMADDLRPELGCYGQGHMVTPNIDAIAAAGTTYTRAYVQYAVSAATRASYLTGCRPSTTGVRYPYTEYFVNEFIHKYPTAPNHFFQNGYYVRTFGKVHHGFGENFTEPNYAPDGTGNADAYYLPGNRAVARDKSKRPAFECADVPDEAYSDGMTTREVLATISRASGSGKPFFFAVGFWKPHLPFNAPKKYWDLYRRDKLPLSPFPSPTEGETRYSRSHYNITGYAGESDEGGHIVSSQRAMELRHAYFACVSYVDAQVGRIIEGLKREGLYENTVIVLIGDHGWHLGDNGMWGKQTDFERATLAPLIVKTARGVRPKVKACDKLVEFVDIYPTLCELAGVAAPGFLEGTSLVPTLTKKNVRWKNAAFSEFVRENRAHGYSVRTDSHRYTRWIEIPSGNLVGEELYDHRTDPLETVNIASSDRLSVERMKAVLDAGWKKALPSGVTNRSDNPPAPKSSDWGPEARNFVTQPSADGGKRSKP